MGMTRMTPAEVRAERIRMDARAKITARLGEVEYRLGALADTLADARRDHANLVGLVERMGRVVEGLALWHDREESVAINDGIASWFGDDQPDTYTLTGQRKWQVAERERRAAMHDAEGEPEGHRLVEDVQ